MFYNNTNKRLFYQIKKIALGSKKTTFEYNNIFNNNVSYKNIYLLNTIKFEFVFELHLLNSNTQT